MAVEYTVGSHDPKTCFICLGLRWDGENWVPDERTPEVRRRK